MEIRKIESTRIFWRSESEKYTLKIKLLCSQAEMEKILTSIREAGK